MKIQPNYVEVKFQALAIKILGLDMLFFFLFLAKKSFCDATMNKNKIGRRKNNFSNQKNKEENH